jgi:transposase InsO family protein
MYVNITRDDCKKFLEGRELSLLTRAGFCTAYSQIIHHRLVSKRVMVHRLDRPFNLQNRHRSYILNTVDAFSRRCFLESLSTKTAPAVLQAIQRTRKRAGVQPHRILSDNGGEFQGEFDEWLKEQGITHTFTQSHSPRQNAICERANKDIQKLIRVLFVHTNSTRWVGAVSSGD